MNANPGWCIHQNTLNAAVTHRICLIFLVSSMRFYDLQNKNCAMGLWRSCPCYTCHFTIFANKCKSYRRMIFESFCSKENVHFVVFWIVLFALLSSPSTWHAEAGSVSGTDVSSSHFSEPPCQYNAFFRATFEHGETGPCYPNSQQDLECDLLSVRREQITLHACFLNS